MAGFIENFKQALNEESVGEHYAVGDTRVTCRFCGNDSFQMSRVQLNTAGMTFRDIDFSDKRAWVLLCPECGSLQWFLKEPEVI